MIGSLWLGKGVRLVSRLRGNGGSALPGLVIERMNPGFVREVLGRLKYGVVVISGTNGKTTTTKIVTELLAKQGLKVFTNDTGSNFVRGVISAIVGRMRWWGKFDFDIAVLELDEAHAVKFAEVVPIEHVLLLNVQRDQLDRFGGVEHVAKLLGILARAARGKVVINRDDLRLAKIKVKHPVYFGLAKELRATFAVDGDADLARAGGAKGKDVAELLVAVELKALRGSRAVYEIDGEELAAKLRLKGIYNAYNAAGALALVKTILPEESPRLSGDTNKRLLADLSEVESAFGRGEMFMVDDMPIELLLVKNPSAFQLSLESFADAKYDFMIAVNDNYADGRDISWLKDVDFGKLKRVVMCSGTRARDMAARLKQDKVSVDEVEADIMKALQQFVGYSDRPKRIFATYTAMLMIRKILTGKSLL